MNMPWGKHKGENIIDLPSDYLHWLAENCEQDNIATAADEEWQEREDFNEHFYE